MTKPTNTSIGPNTRVNGRIAGDTTVDVYGYVRGEIDLRDTLTVHEEGVVDGEVAVDNLVVNGTVRGQLHVRNHLVLTSTARVIATIRTHLFTVEDGARFAGDIETHIGASDSAKPLQLAGTANRRNARSTGSARNAAPATSTGTFSRSSFIRPNEQRASAAQAAEVTEESPVTAYEQPAESEAVRAAEIGGDSAQYLPNNEGLVVVEEARGDHSPVSDDFEDREEEALYDESSDAQLVENEEEVDEEVPSDHFSDNEADDSDDDNSTDEDSKKKN